MSENLRNFRKFFLIGGATCGLSFLITIYWSQLYALITGNPFVFDLQSKSLKTIHELIAYASWLVGVYVLIIHLRRRKFLPTLAYICGAFCVYVSLLAYLLYAPVVSDYLSRQEFNSQEWIEAETTRKPLRIHMIHDLLKNKVLVGKTKLEIQTLLGTPRTTNYFQNYDYVYWLGPERGLFGIDSEWLCLKFQNDIVTRVDILRD